MKKILHVYKCASPLSIGGVENFIDQLAMAQVGLGNEVRVFALDSEHDGFMDYHGYQVRYCKQQVNVASTPFALTSLKAFKQQVLWADVIHYHFPWPFMDVLHLLARVPKPCVVTYHSDIVRQKYLNSLYKYLMRLFFSRVDKIIASSQNYLESSDILSAYPDKTTFIPLGLDQTHYQQESQDTNRFTANLPQKYHLFVGVLRYYKGLHFLLQAMQGTDLTVVIAGSGPYADNLKKLAASLQLKNVHFVGQVTDAEKIYLIKQATSLILPSHLRSEAFGLVLLESACLGKPMISAEIGTGTSYANLNGVTGIVVPPGDVQALRAAMIKLDSDTKLCETLGKGAREYFHQHFQIKRVAQQYQSVYDEVVTRRLNNATV